MNPPETSEEKEQQVFGLKMGKPFLNHGYVYRVIRGHPLAIKKKQWVAEHRRVAMEEMGYTDLPGSRLHVHHKDGDKTNNHPSNLVVISPEDHPKEHSLWRLIDGEMKKPCSACKKLTAADGFYRRKVGFTAKCKPCYRIWSAESKRRCKLNGYKRPKANTTR